MSVKFILTPRKPSKWIENVEMSKIGWVVHLGMEYKRTASDMLVKNTKLLWEIISFFHQVSEKILALNTNDVYNERKQNKIGNKGTRPCIDKVYLSQEANSEWK